MIGAQVENPRPGSPAKSRAEQVLAGGADMGALMRSIDWSTTPLGPVDSWPQSLCTAVNICLSSRFPILIWWGPDMVMLYNDAYRPILGATKHPTAMGQRGRECWPEIWPIIGPMLAGVLERGEATWSNDQMLPLERYGYAEECYFTFSYSPIVDETGQVGGIFTAVTETTHQVLAERRLRTLRDLGLQTGKVEILEAAVRGALEALVDNPFDVPFALFYMLDEAGRLASLAGAVGVMPGQPVSPEVIDLQGGASAETAWPLALVISTGQTARVDSLDQRFSALPPGPWPEPPRTALVLPVGAPTQERPAGLLVVGVNSRRALDDDYRSFFELVAGHVATSLANAWAYEAERRRAEVLAELDRAKTEFFSNISHEFRTPLTLLLGPLEDMLAGGMGRLSAEQQVGLELIWRNSLRLLKLVNTLLDFSRIEANRLQAVYEPTDLATLTAELASGFRSAIERAGLRLLVDCPPLAEPVYVDRDMWEKIVLNLLSNAFKFTFEGEIEVSLHSLPDSVELRVRDTGAGIPAEELPHLFKRFHQVRGTRARTHEGSGIGLALVQELVHLHGGQIAVCSQMDEGSTFTVIVPRGSAHLPLHESDPAPAWERTTLGPQPFVEEAQRWLPDEEPGPGARRLNWKEANLFSRRPPQSPASALILVVDDNADMRGYLARLLAEYWAVEVVADGASALAAARRRPPSLVLTDIMMPGLDGFELLRELRADPRTSTIPVIILSARSGEEAAIEGLMAGADDYLAKPFAARELLARINAHLELARLRREVAHHEQATRMAVERFRVAQELSLDGFTILQSVRNETGRIIDFIWEYANPAAEQMLRHGRDELIGQRLLEVLPGNRESSELFLRYVQVVETGQPHDVELFYNSEGITGWFRNMAVKLADGVAVSFADITDRKTVEEKLKLSLQEKEVLLREVHHRVKNNLQAISNLLYMQSSSLQDEQVREMFQEARNRVRAIALIHEKLYQTRDLARIDFAEYITSLARHLIDSYRITPESIDLTVVVDDVFIDVDTAIPLGVVINELVSNALKHGLPGNRPGKIQIELRTVSEDQFRLSVSDNGVGVPEDIDITQTKSLGLQLVNLLITHMGGMLELHRNNGTRVIVSFAAPKGASL